MYFTYLGMLLVAITPSFPDAAILQSKIPKWWLWLYYLTSTSWSLNAMLTSQFGDVKMKIVAFGEIKSVEDFLKDSFGYRHEQLPLVFILLALWPIVLAILFAYCIAKLNFQRR
ncbi:hypothetical protein Hanom_Chr11g01010921 [Helianthus anomalus]